MEQPPSVVARWLAAGDSGDVEAFDDLMHVDVVVHAPPGLVDRGPRSREQVWRDAVAAIPNRRHEVQEVVAQGNGEMARVVVTGTPHRDFADVDSLDDQRVPDWAASYGQAAMRDLGRCLTPPRVGGSCWSVSVRPRVLIVRRLASRRRSVSSHARLR